MNKLLLFDIDKTLLYSAQGHVEAFAVAFKQVYGVNASMYMSKHHGKTDQQILYEVLTQVGLSEEEIQPKISECMDVMCDYFQSISPFTTADMLPHVEESLKTLSDDGNLLGLVTGNLEPIAHAKLSKVDIDHYFKLGGFGNSAIDRSDLVKIAIRRAGDECRFAVKDNNVVLFGDAPQDMIAAKSGGAVAIAVTTGIYNENELLAAGADYVVDGVGNIKAIHQIIDKF